jgi:lysophospholipid acyltransferase (LPLAT)-like uncharacterized protein
MTLDKRIVRSRAGRTLLAALASLYIRVIHRTTRWKQVVPPATAALLESGAPVIIAFWHGRMIVMRGAWTHRPDALHLLISDHRDGRVISRALEILGFGTVAGSSRRGGTTALRTINRLLRDGATVGITPDGPVGPRMRAKAGAVKAAQVSGAPIIPVSGGVARRRLLGSWDRFCLCLPFTRGLILWGEPLAVPRKADAATLEARRVELEHRLNALTEKADATLGLAAPEPANGPVVARAPGK